MVRKKEKSMVRFQQGPRKSKNKDNDRPAALPNRQKSDLRNIHRYIPRLHRQKTEIPPESILGRTLKTLSESCRYDEEFYAPVRTAARDELRDIIERSFIAISRNPSGIQFLEPIHLLGFAHWQSYPEKRVICFLPIYIQKLYIQPGDQGSAFINLPRRFQPHVSITPVDLRSPYFSGRYLSSQKFFSLIISIVKRVLGLKSIPDDRIHCSETSGTIEIDLKENQGWIGEIVFCLVLNKSDSICYCRKPFYFPLKYCSNVENDEEIETKLDDNDGCFDTTVRPIVSVQSHSTKISKSSKISFKTKDTDVETYGRRNNADDITSLSTFLNKDERSTTNDVDMESLHPSSISPTDHEYDITWYACQPQSENNLVHSISVTDEGVRLIALLIVFKLLQHDWRLLPLTCYHVQSAMLHEAEHALETSPRWQRITLESCVRLLLCRLFYFVSTEYLPHFNLSHLDLWLYLNKKQLTLAKSALGRLVQSDTALLSLARRTARFQVDLEEKTGVSDILKIDFTPRPPNLLKPIAH